MKINYLDIVAEYFTKKCATCGRDLPVPDRQKFCSIHCENLYRKSCNLPILWCSNCGKPVQNPKHLCCSARCHHNDKFRRLNSTLVWLHCDECGKPYSYYPKVYRGRVKRTCSWACARTRKYRYLGHYDSSFLDTDSELRAYFIGLFLADGCFNAQSGVSIALTDKQIIDDLAYWIKYKNSLRATVTEGRKPVYAIRLYGEFCDKFKRLGFIPGKKAHRLEIPKCISKETFPHFLRGFVDGDGSFYMHSGKVRGETVHYLNFKLVSVTKKFLDDVLARLKEYKVIFTDCTPACASPNGWRKVNLYSFDLGHSNAVNIGDYIYKNATIGLKRKYNVYKKAKEINLEVISCKGKTCTYPGCDQPMRTSGLCQHHYTLKYNAAHKEKQKLYNKQYREKNLQKILDYRQEYYIVNREKLLMKERLRREKNRDNILEKDRRYYYEVRKPRLAAKRDAARMEVP